MGTMSRDEVKGLALHPVLRNRVGPAILERDQGWVVMLRSRLPRRDGCLEGALPGPFQLT